MINELREITSKGGKKSGEVRRKKRDMKKCMDMLLSLKPGTFEDYDTLASVGVVLDDLEDDELSNMLVVNAALLAKAKGGDVNAVKELRKIIRDDDLLKHKIKHDNELLKIEKAKNAPPTRDEKVYNGIPAGLIAPAFSAVLFDITDYQHSEYVFPGGRGCQTSTVIRCIISIL